MFKINHVAFFWIFPMVVKLNHIKSVLSLTVSPDMIWEGVKFGTMPFCLVFPEELTPGSKSTSLWSFFSCMIGLWHESLTSFPDKPYLTHWWKVKSLYALNLQWEYSGMWEKVLLYLDHQLVNNSLDKWCIYFGYIHKKFS